MARDPDPSPAPNQGVAVWGWNGTDWEVLLVDGDGHLKVDVTSVPSTTVTGSVSVSNFPATQPVSGSVSVLGTLVPYVHDYVSLSYTGTDLTGVVFKTGGSAGTTVATLTLAYVANVLQSVTRT